MATVEEYLEGRQGAALEELKEFLAIPSISTLSEHAGDMRRAAGWVAKRLEAAGIEHVQMIPTGGQHVIYGDWLHAPGQPTVLIYGHYDVQPADPLDLWESPPFEPTVRDGAIYARGASDMKANVLITILGVEAQLRTAVKLPINVKFIIEGQEEIGSPDLVACIEGHPGLFDADLLISADGGQWTIDIPALLLGTRGLVSLEIHVRGAQTDLHSGVYGGAVANPARALARIITSLHAPDDTVLVEGLYDDVATLSEEERAAISQVPFDEGRFRNSLGVTELTGEPGFSALERSWVRPSLEVNGMWSGFQGEGVKTVLPAEAHAKISCRLAPHQRPERVAEQITAHIRRQDAPGVTVDVEVQQGSSLPYYLPPDHWGNQAIASVLARVYSRQPVQARMGATLPMCEMFQRLLGIETVGLGFSLLDERMHAPNEFFRLSSFEHGQRAWAFVLEEIARARERTSSGEARGEAQ